MAEKLAGVRTYVLSTTQCGTREGVCWSKGRKIIWRVPVGDGLADEDPQETNRKAGIAYAAAFSLFAAVVSGLIIGWLLDRWLGTRPWLLVAGVVVGSIAGFYEFIRSTSKLS